MGSSGVESIARGCPQLQELVLVQSGVRAEGLQELAKNGGDDLQVLNLAVCSYNAAVLEQLLAKNKGLRCLDLSGSTNVINQSLEPVLVAGGSHLRDLDISNMLLSDVGVNLVAQYCFSNLETLKIAKSTLVNAAAVASIAVCKNLKYLDISYTRANDEALLKIIQGCPSLRHISAPNTRLENPTLEAIGKYLPHISYLDLSSCNVDDAGLQILATHCTLLRTLILYGCSSITDKSCLYLSQDIGKGLSSELEILNMGDCGQITENGVEYLAQGCQKLRELVVDRCNRVTGKSLLILLEKCRNMRRLSFLYCRIFDAEKTQLTQAAPHVSFN